MNAAFRFTSQANGTFTERAARADHRESDERRIWGTEATESSFEDVIQPQEKLKPEDVYRSQRSAFVKHSPAKPNRPSRAIFTRTLADDLQFVSTCLCSFWGNRFAAGQPVVQLGTGT
jgi:hypothetical protein